jgi:hypothetical protein
VEGVDDWTMLLMHDVDDDANDDGGATMAYHQSTMRKTDDVVGPGDSYGGGSTFYGMRQQNYLLTPQRNNDGMQSE